MLEIRNPGQAVSIDRNAQMNKDYIKEKVYDPVARIIVLGIGGAGNNAINRMIEDGVIGVEFVGINTDKQDLTYCKAPLKIVIGEKLTGGRGCGAQPEIGEGAANESKEQIRQILRENAGQKKADMVFITCGMGGGTGTGAAPIIAGLAKEEGILTVAVVTKPFRFEGRKRMTNALNGINKLFPNVDTLITIPNDRLINLVEAQDGFKESFAKADQILKQSITGVTDLINLPALVNLDFADIATVMRGKGLAHIAIGEARGEGRVVSAIKKAIESPLLETTIDGATDMIVCMSGQVSLIDVDNAMREIEPKLNPDCNIIFGAREDENLKDAVSVTLIATGLRDSSTNQNMYQAQRTNNNQFSNQGFSSQSMKNPNFNLDMTYKDFSNRDMNVEKTQNKEQKGIASFFQKKDVKKDENEEKSKSIDNLNVDLSKLDFAKNDEGTSSLLPDFITDSFKK